MVYIRATTCPGVPWSVSEWVRSLPGATRIRVTNIRRRRAKSKSRSQWLRVSSPPLRLGKSCKDGRSERSPWRYRTAAWTGKKAQLLLNRYGDRYFLTQVWNGEGGQGTMIPKSRHETELARDFAEKTGGGPQAVSLIVAGR